MSRSRPTARSDREPGRAGSPENAPEEVLEEQQASLLSILRRAHGAPVSYHDLQDLGIEFPASVVSELELAGVDLDRCHIGEKGAGAVMGVRLEPSRDPFARSGPVEQAATIAHGPGRPGSDAAVDDPAPGRPGRWRGRRPRMPAGRPLALAAAALLVVAIAVTAVLIARGGGDGGGPARVAKRSATDRGLAGAGARHPTSATGSPGRADRGRRAPGRPRGQAGRSENAGGHGRGAGRPAGAAGRTSARRTSGELHPKAPQIKPNPVTPVSPVLAHELDVQGHELLDAGSYPAAIRVLSRTLEATGESTGRCLEPVSESCLLYAYALYDLGRALQLSGHAAAALPYLERRLRIDNQRSAVAEELALARSEIG